MPMAVAKRISQFACLTAFGLACLVGVPTLGAQENAPRVKQPPIAKPKGDEKPKDKKLGGMTPAREAAALAFVREHHAELESLLARLKERQPKQYEAAIRDLFRHSERLANVQEKDASRYDLELRAWKLQSRVQLLSATVLMNPQDKDAKAKLRQAIVEQLQLRQQALVAEREHVAKRLQKLDEQIERAAGDLEVSADRQLQAILSGARPKLKDVQKTSTPSGNDE
jgi:hypothetical protein